MIEIFLPLAQRDVALGQIAAEMREMYVFRAIALIEAVHPVRRHPQELRGSLKRDLSIAKRTPSLLPRPSRLQRQHKIAQPRAGTYRAGAAAFSPALLNAVVHGLRQSRELLPQIVRKLRHWCYAVQA